MFIIVGKDYYEHFINVLLQELDYIKNDNGKSKPTILCVKARKAINYINKLFSLNQYVIGQTPEDVAKNKEKFLLSECKRIEEGYKRAMNQVQQKLEGIISTQEKHIATKLKEIECQYTEKIEQMRLTQKYKSKC